MEVESSTPNGQDRSSNALLSNTPTAFCCFGSRRRSSWWERVRSTPWSQSREVQTIGDRWWSRGLRALKKLREWSEIVAGPRWKTFIRRFTRNRNSKRMASSYQYDPLSYALNFDEGQNGEFKDDGYDGFRNFSTRYAVPVPVPVPVNYKSVSSESEEGKDVAVFV